MSVRVVLVDDSAICRAELREVLERDADIRVVAEAHSGSGVIELLGRHRPDLLALDLEMPGVNGLATIEQVMARHPLPILVITGLPQGSRQSSVFESIRRGALDLAQKPAPRDVEARRRLRGKVRELSQVRVVRHLEQRAFEARAGTLLGRRPLEAALPPGPELVSVVASAGGPSALVELLCEFPPDFKGCLAVVQHLPRGFAPAFAHFLAGRVRLEVCLVEREIAVRAGTVFLAPDDRHLELRSARELAPRAVAAADGVVPSGDVLFESVAKLLGARAGGIVLSGIGSDGTAGLKALRARGGLTLAQDAASAAVYGMPRSALESGGAERALPPRELARAVLDWARGGGRGA